MSFVVGILTFVLVFLCVFLILLVLVQLPKKDAGAGMAFGGGTADALFGAGSGNVLTKITKFTAAAFLLLSLFLGYLESRLHNQSSGADFTKMVEQKQQQAPVVPATVPAKAPATAPAAPNNNLLSATLATTATNAAAPVSTNAAKPSK